MHVQQLLTLSLNRGQLILTCFFTKLMTSLIESHVAFFLNTLLSTNCPMAQSYERAYHECWVLLVFGESTAPTGNLFAM